MTNPSTELDWAAIGTFVAVIVSVTIAIISHRTRTNTKLEGFNVRITVMETGMKTMKEDIEKLDEKKANTELVKNQYENMMSQLADIKKILEHKNNTGG